MKKQFLSFLILLFFTFSVFSQSNEARKVDEFEDISCDEMIGRLQNLGIEVTANSQATAFIIFYEGKHRSGYSEKDSFVLPKFGDSAARTKAMQERLFFLKYESKQFLFIDGGLREKYTVEFWIVPKGATPPKPTPTLKTIKYRRGKPTYSCKDI